MGTLDSFLGGMFYCNESKWQSHCASRKLLAISTSKNFGLSRFIFTKPISVIVLEMVLSLPKTSFVPVPTYQMAAPIVAWNNTGLFTSEDAINNAFCIRQNYEPSSSYTTHDRIQQADRYGGHGVGHGGGSGRCAIYGNLQVKGVGRTPLVPREADPFHTSGTLMLREAAREVIFSKIFECFLPHGVVQPLAVVLTGGMFRYEVSGTDGLHHRALLLREFTLRPAHYLRNAFNRAESVIEGYHSRDAIRANCAINTLDQGVEEVLGAAVIGTSGIDRINLGLKIFAQRVAAQLAASFSRRIFQTALNCSNVALDGRFLDFGVTTYVEGYRKRAWGEKWLDQWSQQEAVLRTLHLLRFAVYKYWKGTQGNLIVEADLTAEFQMALQARMEIEMIKMTGAPEEFVVRYPLEGRRRFFHCLQRIYTCGANEAFTIWPATAETSTGNPAPEKTGRFDLNLILSFAATCATNDEMDQVLAPVLNDEALRGEFIRCYSDLRQFCLACVGNAGEAADMYWMMQGVRINANLSFLKYERLDEQLMEFNEQPDGLGDFIDATIAAGCYALQSDHPDIPDRGPADQVHRLSELGDKRTGVLLHGFSKIKTRDEVISRMREKIQ